MAASRTACYNDDDESDDDDDDDEFDAVTAGENAADPSDACRRAT